jgi:hypothetical protein
MTKFGRLSMQTRFHYAFWGLALSVGLSVSAQAKQLIQCVQNGSADITISLGMRQAYGESLACIKAPFAVDMTPCAPFNGFGMSAGTGSAALVGVSHDWQGYMKHMGPVMGFHVDEVSYTFTGMFIGYKGMTEQWSFQLSRVTGKGAAKTPGQPTVTYQCALVHQKL